MSVEQATLTCSDAPYRVGSFEFESRLFAGTGKYESFELMRDALDASESQVVTVAVRRDVLTSDGQAKSGSILDHLDLDRYTILPNTAGCFNVKDAVRSARLSRDLREGLGNAGAIASNRCSGVRNRNQTLDAIALHFQPSGQIPPHLAQGHLCPQGRTVTCVEQRGRKPPE